MCAVFQNQKCTSKVSFASLEKAEKESRRLLVIKIKAGLIESATGSRKIRKTSVWRTAAAQLSVENAKFNLHRRSLFVNLMQLAFTSENDSLQQRISMMLIVVRPVIEVFALLKGSYITMRSALCNFTNVQTFREMLIL